MHVPVVTLSTQDNIKVFKQLQPVFKRKPNWNKYQSEKSNSSAKQIFTFFT